MTKKERQDSIKLIEALLKNKIIPVLLHKNLRRALKSLKKYEKIINLNDKANEKEMDSYGVISEMIDIIGEDLE